jgi:hypothetical protein
MNTKRNNLCLAPKTGARLPDEQIIEIEHVLDDAKSGAVSGFVLVACGPDFNKWRQGYVSGAGDRMNLLGQLQMAIRAIEDAELES